MTKPKILILGMNKNQCTRQFYLRQQLKVIPSHYSLYNALVDMGYDVDQRTPTLGEDLSQYDEVIAFIAGPRQLVATSVFECLWAISQHPNCILASDDWQVPDLFKGVVKCDGNPDELFAQFILDVNKKTLEDVKPYEAQFMAALKTIANMKNRMLISAYSTSHLSGDYGPHHLFGKIEYPRDRLFTYNPNPYHRNRVWEDIGHDGAENPDYKKPTLQMNEVEPRPVKERRFNFASLVQSKTQKWLKKQGFTGSLKDEEAGDIGTWAVDLYGSKKESQKRLTEDEMVKVITRDWGCLMPAYEHSKSAWWRARPLQCAMAKSILIGAPEELAVYYGEDYPYFDLTAQDLPNLSDSELTEIADTQYEAIMRIHPLDKEVQKEELSICLSAVK